MSEQSGEGPKIFVDEGWKERVEAEKHAAAAKQAEQKPHAPTEQSPVAESSGGNPASSLPEQSSAHPEVAPPPASLSFLITTLATQAMRCLGQMANPITGKGDTHLPGGKALH